MFPAITRLAISQRAGVRQAVRRRAYPAISSDDVGTMIVPSMRETPNFDSPVLITGLPRSGTSMVAGILGECGLWLGKTVPGGGKENAKGFFENILLREKAQKAILSAAGFDPLGVRRLPPPGWRLAIPDFRSGIAELLLAQGYEGDRLWGFKDPKTTLTWRIWHEHFPGATWVVVRRPAEDVVASCLRTGFMNQHSTDPNYWRVFVRAYELHLAQLCRSVAKIHKIESTRVVAGDLRTIQNLAAMIGLIWEETAARQFVSRDLWHASEEPV